MIVQDVSAVVTGRAPGLVAARKTLLNQLHAILFERGHAFPPSTTLYGVNS